MKPVNILVIGRHPQIMETVLRLLNGQPDWQAQGALTDDHAQQLFYSATFHLVLIGGGVDDESERKLRDTFVALRPETRIIRHFGGGSGLLFNEIRQALESVKRETEV